MNSPYVIPPDSLVDSEAWLAQAKAMAVANISGFSVGAALMGESGAVYLGSNIEFPGTTYADTIHAEQFALILARHAGETGIRKLFVTERPCGHCRQFLLEAGQPDLPILFDEDSLSGQRRLMQTTLSALLPFPFTLSGMENNLFRQAARKIQLPEGFTLLTEQAKDPSLEEKLIHQALIATEASYCPLIETAWAGLALSLKDSNTIVTGNLVESAAFNPALPPLQSALIQLIALASPSALSHIQHAVLVESSQSPFSYAETTLRLLQRLSPQATLSAYQGSESQHYGRL